MGHRRQAAWTGVVLLAAICMAHGQGSLTPPGLPGPTMATFEQIHGRIDTARQDALGARLVDMANVSNAVAAARAEAADNEPRTPITSLPYTVTQSGSYYLTGNLSTTGNGITIQADDVTLDLMGFTITGDEGYNEHGIYVLGSAGHPYRRVVVRDGIVRNFYSGVSYVNTCDGRIDGITAGDCTHYGVVLSASSGPCRGNIVRNCSVDFPDYSSPCYGIFLNGFSGSCEGNIVEDIRVNIEHGGVGIYMTSQQDGACRGNLVKNCASVGGGFHVAVASGGLTHGNIVENCRALEGGFVVYGGSDRCEGNVIRNCTSQNRDGAGIQLNGWYNGGACTGSRVEHSIVNGCTNSGSGGIEMHAYLSGQVEGNLVKDCTVVGTVSGHGVYSTGECRRVTIENCVLVENDNGVFLSSKASDNTVKDCVVVDNAYTAIKLDQYAGGTWTTGNRIDGNFCAGDYTYGIATHSASTNLITRNSCFGFANNYYQLIQDAHGPVVTTVGPLSSTGDPSHPWANFSY